MLRVTFKDTASRDNFCTRFKLDSKVGEAQADINWHLLQFAKLDDNALDYDEVSLLQAQAAGTEHNPSIHEFVVKGDPAVFGAHATVQKDLGNGFYLVTSSNGTVLGDHVDSIEHNSMGMTYLSNTVGIDGMNDTPASVDLNSSDAQWHRIRVASRYRPLLSKYALHDVTYLSKPEVIVMDSGINFNHEQFSDPDLETENFYALPVFNGDFTDTRGHGTGVASMICGKDLGIASHLKLVSVKIGSTTHNATLQEVGDAIDAILARIISNPLQTRIVNMSWGVARSAWLDSKVEALMNAGATVVCAAGNNGISVEDISPAGIDDVITVAAMDKFDIPSGFNNISPSDAGVTTGHGLSLDIFAPGENIVIAKNDVANPGAVTLGSGTSLAAPLVSGVACVIASMRSGLVPVSELKQIVLSTATKDALLFEDDRFTENQNNLIYIAIADTNTQYKDSDSASYIGFFAKAGWEQSLQTINIITIDLKNCLVSTTVQPLVPNESFSYGVTWDDPALEAKYGSCVSVDPVTGILTVTRPNVSFDPDVKIDVVMFRGTLSSQSVNMISHKIFFFNVNPDLDVKKTDMTSILTDTNSISFYAAWGYIK